MKLNKKKVFTLAIAVCLIATLSLGSLAWFTDTDSVTNDFHVAGSEDDPDDIFSVDVWENGPDGRDEDGIRYPNILPGDVLQKEVNIENTGSYDQYIRAIVTVSDASIWQEIFGEVYVPLDKIVENLNTAYDAYRVVFDADADTLTYVLYYQNILKVDAVSTLFTDVVIPEALTREQAAAMKDGFVIGVVAQAVQTENVGANAVEAFKTVDMEVEAGEHTVATTAAGLQVALASDVDFVMTSDIDMAGLAWSPVGTEEAPFTSTFDGNGYTIFNLKIDDIGMFAYVGENAVIKNLKFDNVSVDGGYSAVVANYAEKATFENIEILSGNIDVEKYGASIVFEAYNITITDCVNRANVTAGYSASGIGGWVYTSTVDGCENYGDVVGANRAGGICANFSGTMTNCTNNGNVTSTGSMPAGGIVGVLGGASTIENCTNNGNVTTTADNANASAAGILAQTPSAKVTIKSCTNNGNITAEKSHAAGIGVSLYGGITAEGCANTGVIVGGDGAADVVAAKGVFGGKNTIQ